MLHKNDINRLLTNRTVVKKCDKALAPSGEISKLGNEFYLRTNGSLVLLEPESIPENISEILEAYSAAYKVRSPYSTR